MTGVRYSIAIAKESEYGEAATTGWMTLPPGSFMSSTHNVSTSTIYGAGSKTFNTQSYGRVAESWEYSFTLDYENLGPLLMIFDTYSVESAGNGKYRHTFSTSNNRRVPSFTIRRKFLNRITDPNVHDETNVMTGCVAKSIRISRSSGNSQATVTISGFGRKDTMDVSNLESTDFKEYEGSLAEFSCMFIGDDYVANVESLTIGIDINSAALYTTCTPFAVGYNVGTVSNQFGFTCYSNDPLRYKALVYTGGQDASKANISGTMYAPMCKNKAPVPLINLRTFDTCKAEGETMIDAFERAGKSMEFRIEDCVVKSASWQKGDGGRLLDQMSSAECKRIVLTIVNGVSSY